MQQKKPLRIGEILIQQGVLSEQQVFEIVQAQKRSSLPFGILAEQMFEVTIESIEHAWVEQYCSMTGTLDLAEVRIDRRALQLLSRRQAWQFEMVPLGFEEAGELLVACSRKRLARAVTFTAQQFKMPVFFRVAEEAGLRQLLRKHYPMPEVKDRLLERARKMASGETTPSGKAISAA